MTIRRRLAFSFAAVIALFGATLAVYLWSAHLRDVTMKRLDRTLKRQVLLATIGQDLDNLHKQVALLSEVEADAAQTPPDPVSKQAFNGRLSEVSSQIQALKGLSEPDDKSALAQLESTYSSLSQAWKTFYDNLGVEPAWAIASAAKADPLSFRLQTQILPQIEAMEKDRVRTVEVSLARVESLTNGISSGTFLFSLFFAAVVAVLISRSIGRGFNQLQHGADLIGNMNLDHRITLNSKDELGQFARSFNTMTERLHLARKELTAANEELERRNQEIRERQAQELNMAATIQQGLMAVRIPELPFASIRARNISCTQIGGDFYDVVPVENGVAVIICDVSGKGISAAIMASMLQGMIRSELAAKVPLDVIATEANRFFTQRDVAGKYATLCIVFLHPDGTCEYVNCGHVAPVLVDSEGGIQRLTSNNAPVGLLPMMEFGMLRCELNTGDRLVLVTDGVTEAASSDDSEFGDQRLEVAAVASDAFETLFSEVSKFCGENPLNDDCTVVEIVYSGAAREKIILSEVQLSAGHSV
jgi:serine phosphatase RsbU (regulator of sigma subunit)